MCVELRSKDNPTLSVQIANHIRDRDMCLELGTWNLEAYMSDDTGHSTVTVHHSFIIVCRAHAAQQAHARAQGP